MRSTRTHPAKRIRAIGLAATSLLTAGLLAFAAQSAPAEVIGPAVVLGPTTVVNGVAIVSGSVGVTNSNAAVTINGRSMDVDAVGHFAGVVDLGGQSSLTIGVVNPVTGKEATTTIPLTTDIVGPGGVISPTVLDNLERAAVELIEPAGGFVTDGLPFTVGGNVGDPDSLSSLTVNGEDVLGSLDSNRSFSIQVPGTLKEIQLSATDRQGTIQTFSVSTRAGKTVSAANAVGLRIAKVRYIVKNVNRTKRLRMIVTIKDSRGLLVRGASVRVRSARAMRLVGNPRVKKTNKVGQAAFLLRAHNLAFGKRLVMVTLAQTPKAKAKASSSVRLPRRAKPAASR
jgi:hypothetical protein